MKRTTFVAFLLAVALVPVRGLSQSRPALVDEMGYADIVLVNGKIVSMDDRSAVPDTPGRIFRALAIKAEKIMALGSDEEMRRLAGPKTQIIDLGGKTVIPGLIETHYHIFSPAVAKQGPSQGLVDPSVKLTVVAEQTAEATAKKIRDTVANAVQVQKIPKGQWITVALDEGKENRRGTTNTWLYLGNINRRQIDSATSEHPVFVKAGGVQSVFNSVAIEEIKKLFPDWEESTDLENRIGAGKDGQGAVPEIQGLAFELWWKDEPLEKLAEALRLEGLELQGQGITTVATRILYPSIVAAYHLLNRQDRMPHRLAYYIESQRGNFFSLKSTREFYKGMGAPWTTHAAGNRMLWLNGMSNEVWDSIQNEVCLGPDAPAPPEIKARERCPGPGSKPWESVKAGIVTGWRPVQVHATTTHGARLYIRMMEEAMKEGNYSVEYMRNLRTTMEHNMLMGNLPDVMDGVKKYGILINVNMSYLYDVPENIKDYGERIRPFAMPVKSWLNDGVRVTFEAAGTDFWTPIYSLVTRRIPKKGLPDVVLLPEEAIDRVSALKMATTWASEYMMAEDTVGTLEAGKYADLAVLEKDFFTIPIEEIRNLKVIMTVMDGKIVHDQIQHASAR
ncbi:MAG: amidohydrolase family protein [Acidobacteria bacterium]|nr:amidohydrolase family protein [Acidobacteriota bacterium]